MNISFERLEQIELERQDTLSNPAFSKWMKELKVGTLHTNQEPRTRAEEMMNMWIGKSGGLNSFSNIF